MKNQFRKLLAVTAAIVLLVSVMAIGTFSTSAATYAKTKSFSSASPSGGLTLTNALNGDGKNLPEGYVAFGSGGNSASGTAVLNVGEVFTSFEITTIDSADDTGLETDKPTIKFSADGSTWETLVLSRTSGNYYQEGWLAKYITYTGAASASKGYKYVQISASANTVVAGGLPLAAFGSFNYNTPSGDSTDISNAEETVLDFNQGKVIENFGERLQVENMAIEQIGANKQAHIGAVSKLNVWSPSGATQGAAYFNVYTEGKKFVSFKFTVITGGSPNSMGIKAYGDVSTEIPLTSTVVTPAGAGYTHIEFSPVDTLEDFSEIALEFDASAADIAVRDFTFYSVDATPSTQSTKPTTNPTTQSTTKPATKPTTPVTQPSNNDGGTTGTTGGLTYEDGLQDGYNDGYNGGYNDGYNGGYNDGYDGGYNDGYGDGGYDDGGYDDGTGDDGFDGTTGDDWNNDDYFGDDFYDDTNNNDGGDDTQNDTTPSDPVDGDPQDDEGNGILLWVIIGVAAVVVIAGAAAAFIIIKKKKAAASADVQE
ncbi:MAG: hypothetical protein IJF42_07480 [Clostridia bacterium]|nr:hypothetical protein [Clostridia bacterium]